MKCASGAARIRGSLAATAGILVAIDLCEQL